MDTSKQQNSIRGVSEPPDGIARFTVYGEPVSKLRARTVRQQTKSGKTFTNSYTPEKTEIQEFNVVMVYKSIYRGFGFDADVPLRVVVTFFLQIPKSTSKIRKQRMLSGLVRPTKRPDVENVAKLIMDALNTVAYHDDSQIVELEVRKFYSDQPRTEIFIARICDENE